MKQYFPRCNLSTVKKKRSGVVTLSLPPHIISHKCLSCQEDSVYCVHKRKDGRYLCESCYRKSTTAPISKNRQWLWDHKASVGCVLCHENDPSCLDYHHMQPNKKKFSIGSVASSIPDKAFHIEMKKCVVLCANCHRKVEVALAR